MKPTNFTAVVIACIITLSESTGTFAFEGNFSAPYRYKRASTEDENPDSFERRVFLLPTVKVPDVATFRAQAYATQNCYRARHGADPLTPSSKLESYAQNWANHLATTNAFDHSQGSYGENLYADSSPRMDGTSPIKAWYAEGKNYNYNANSGSSGTGHFTQVVWKGSKSCGISYSTSPRWTIVVAEYDPPGNFLGKYAQNVGRPSGPNQNCPAVGLAAGSGGNEQGSGHGGGGGGGGDGGAEPETTTEFDYTMGGTDDENNQSPPRPHRPPPNESPSRPPGRPPSRPPSPIQYPQRPPGGRPPSQATSNQYPQRPPNGRPPSQTTSNQYPQRPPGRPQYQSNRPPNRPYPPSHRPIDSPDEDDWSKDTPPCEDWWCSRITSVKVETMSKNTTTFFLDKK